MATTRRKAAPHVSGTPFAGFRPDACTFFTRLATHNTREWFQPRKDEFERVCVAPLKALAVALDPPLGADWMSRIHRDVRFAKDKSPYHTHVSARVGATFLWLSADGLYVGTGLYMPDPRALARMRSAIDADASGKPLAQIVATLRKKGYTVASHESVASAPRGFAADHPRIELLRMKDIHAGTTLRPHELTSATAIAKVRKVRNDVAPLREWLVRHVGPQACG